MESKEGIKDRTEAKLVNLGRIIYLTIMNALNYEEAVHKLLKIELQEGQEVRTIFFLTLSRRQKTNWSYLGWAHEHDHMLLSRMVVLYVLRTYWRTVL